MSNQIQTVNFHNQSLITLQKDGIAYVAMKPICENIGLSWNAQFERLQRDEVLNSTIRMMRTVGNDGKSREMLCLPIQYLNGWLFGVDVSRVKAEIKDKIITYKKECYQVLHDYWNKGVAINPRLTISISQQSSIRQAIAKRCKLDSVHYQTVYTALQKHFDIPRYTELLASDFAEAMAFIDTIELVQSFPSQSFLTPSDLKTLGKVICYASMYAEFAQTVKKDKGQSAVGTYNATIGNDDDGFLMVFHPKFEKDIEQAQILFKRIAQHSLLPVG